MNLGEIALATQLKIDPFPVTSLAIFYCIACALLGIIMPSHAIQNIPAICMRSIEPEVEGCGANEMQMRRAESNSFIGDSVSPEMRFSMQHCERVFVLIGNVIAPSNGCGCACLRMNTSHIIHFLCVGDFILVRYLQKYEFRQFIKWSREASKEWCKERTTEHRCQTRNKHICNHVYFDGKC